MTRQTKATLCILGDFILYSGVAYLLGLGEYSLIPGLFIVGIDLLLLNRLTRG